MGFGTIAGSPTKRKREKEGGKAIIEIFHEITPSVCRRNQAEKKRRKRERPSVRVLKSRRTGTYKRKRNKMREIRKQEGSMKKESHCITQHIIISNIYEHIQ